MEIASPLLTKKMAGLRRHFFQWKKTAERQETPPTFVFRIFLTELNFLFIFNQNILIVPPEIYLPGQPIRSLRIS